MPKIREGLYVVRRFRRAWCIRQVKNLKPNGSYQLHGVPGDPEFYEREDAIKHMFQLNGWKYTEKK